MPVQKMNRAIKYRAYPTDEQASLIIRTCGCVRFVWNQMLSDARRFQEETDVFFIPTPAKYKTSYPFLKEVDSLALANTQLDLKGARKAFCKGNARAPQFKSRCKSKMSYTTNHQTRKRADGSVLHTVELDKNYVRLPKIGNLKIKKHRGPKKDWILKSATIERTRSGKFFVSLLFEFEMDITPIAVTKEKSLGLDYSSSNFYVDSNGDKANAPHCFRKMEDKLARAQQKLARMEKGSHHYEDQLHKIQLIHEKIANQRKNFCHTLSAVIAKQWAAVFVEDINLRGMAGSLKLGKSTNDNGFGMFREMLAYKLAAQGKVFAKIDRWYPSSKACHKCGYINDNLTLQDREWTCPCCGTHHDRDHNAAINIRDKGLADLLSA